ncbi:S-layer homology domain-containing protein [Paenibacillus sp. sgz500958]|uniref:S-layer homology domain-containing protein n=1 Tax=Paenibacillus sp. sgz500958 TaxID=3242475 RepID=UPI0036D21D83
MKKVISIMLAISLTLMLLPVTALAASTVTVTGLDIYANGNAIILTAGTTANYTCVYLDNDGDGQIDAGVDLIQTISGPAGSGGVTGYDLQSYNIYGGNQSTALAGDTKITMLGGKIAKILGGGKNAAATVVSTNVTINGGTVGVVHGGGSYGSATGSTSVTVNGGTISFSLVGGAEYGAVNGSTNITFNSGTTQTLSGGGWYPVSTVHSTNITVNGGTISSSLFGGGSNGSVNDSTNITVNGGTINGLNGGGWHGTANVAGSTNITVNGGMIDNSIYGGGSDASASVGSTSIIVDGGMVVGDIDASRYVTGTKSLKITGGSINGTVSGATPTMSDGITPVYKTMLTLSGVNSQVVSSTLALGGLATGYGMTHVRTTSFGLLTFYLPLGDSTAVYNTNNMYFVATVAGTGSDAFIQAQSTAPTVTNAMVSKSSATQAAASFTLNSALTGTWKVYNATTGGSLVAGVTANASGTTLTLTHATDLPAGTYYVSLTETGTTESIRLALTVSAYAAPTYAVSASTNPVTASGVTATATFGASSYVAGATATVTITLSGTATASGTHTIGLTSAADAGTITAPASITKTVSSGDAPTDTFTFTFTMPANAVDDLVVTHTFIQVQSTAPTVTNATISKSAATQLAVDFTLSSVLSGTWKVYNAPTVGSLVAGVTASASGNTLTLTHATDLPAGTYYVSLTETGTTESTRLALTVGAYVAPISSQPSGGNTTTPATNSGADIIVNGTTIIAGTAADTTENGKKITTVTVDVQKLEQKLMAEGDKATVTIPVKTNSDIIIGELNGQMVKNMENKQAVVEVKTGVATYTLPAQQINIDAVSGQLGKDVELKDIKVAIEIVKPAQETMKIVENAEKAGQFTIIAPAMEFNIRCSYKGKAIDVNQFNAYVVRTIAIPEGVDHTHVTTGVIIDPDGTVRHVPTQVILMDGKYYAQINSLTNSTYSVIWNPIEFKDAGNHWAKDAINDMGSRKVISGVGHDRFEPNRDITRAEFAAIVVRGLGLQPVTGIHQFTDVSSTEWYGAYIQTAYEYGIISGYGNGTFGPMDKITREQAMTMINKAMTITGLHVEVKANEAEALLAAFGDAQQSSTWSKESMAACIKAGIVSGMSDFKLAPKDRITRAEVAVIVRRLLQKSNLI